MTCSTVAGDWRWPIYRRSRLVGGSRLKKIVQEEDGMDTQEMGLVRVWVGAEGATRYDAS